MFNLAETICRKHEDASLRVAVEESRSCGTNTYTFGGLDYLSDKFAKVLQGVGLKQGDVVAIILQPSAAFVVAHFAALKLGAIVAPLPAELPVDLLESLLSEIQIKALVMQEPLFEESENLPEGFNDLPIFIATDYVSKNDFGRNAKGFWYEINQADDEFNSSPTSATTPAYVFFEKVENSHLTRTFYFHGIIHDGLCDNERQGKNTMVNGETRQSPEDWSSKNALFDDLYPAWFSGCSVNATA